MANGSLPEGYTWYADIAEMYHNRYGYLPWDDRHYVKLNGSYHLPWGVILGAGFGWRSGRPYNRLGQIGEVVDDTNAFDAFGAQYFIDPRGSHRLGSVWWLDLRLSKDFNIRDTELSVILDVFNVANNQFVLSRREIDGAAWGTANFWQPPGNVVVGLKYSF